MAMLNYAGETCEAGNGYTAAPQRGLRQPRLQDSSTKLYMGVRHDTWVLWFRSPIYQAVGHCVLPAPVSCQCLLSDAPLSVAGLSRLPVHESGTLCHRRRHQPSRCLCSVSV